MYWVTDPKTKEQSVSLTILMVSLLAVFIAGGLQVAGVVSSTSVFENIFFSSCALYFGRKLNFGGKSYTSDTAEEITNKVGS
jgi:hypothetical protein